MNNSFTIYVPITHTFCFLSTSIYSRNLPSSTSSFLISAKFSLTPVIEVDAVLDVGGVTSDLADYIEKLEPFGAGNQEPVLMMKNVRIAKSTLIGVGHVRCVLMSENGGSVKAIAFRVGDNQIGADMLNAGGKKFDVVGILRHDRWNGRNDVQFIINDVRKV